MTNALKLYCLKNLETGLVKGYVFLTEKERNTFNYAYALNGTQLRYL